MKDNVSDADKHERFNRLLKVIEAGVMSHSSQMVGKTYDVLVDGPSKKDPNMLSGYTETGKLINFPGPASLKGLIVPVKIKEDHAFSMIGELTRDPLLLLGDHLAKCLKEEPEAKNYLSAKKNFESDASIQALRDSIEDAQKRMMSFANQQKDEDYQKAKKDYETLLAQYKEHPVYLNLEHAEEELSGLLAQISGELQ